MKGDAYCFSMFSGHAENEQAEIKDADIAHEVVDVQSLSTTKIRSKIAPSELIQWTNWSLSISNCQSDESCFRQWHRLIFLINVHGRLLGNFPNKRPPWTFIFSTMFNAQKVKNQINVHGRLLGKNRYLRNSWSRLPSNILLLSNRYVHTVASKT